MSEQNAVIQAVYADFRLIKTRSCLQLVFEVPVERATEALAIFGVPNHLTDVHVAIARLQAPAKEVMSHTAEPGNSDTRRSDLHKALPHSSGGGAPSQAREAPSEPEEATRKVDTTKSERAKASYRMSDDGERAVTRAAMLCAASPFQDWLRVRQNKEPWRPGHERTEWTGIYLRSALGIFSRKEIATDERVYAAFLALEAEYKLATGQMAEIR